MVPPRILKKTFANFSIIRYLDDMKKILHIIASPREDESRTLQISEAFLEVFLENHPDYILDELNLSKEDLPQLGTKSVSGKYMLLEGKDLFGRLKESWAEILQYIEGFLSAELYIISTPMWNFSIPYLLKQYIDLIVQPKYLFRYTESGKVEGLVKNKKMIVIVSRGGQYQTGEAKGFDFQEPYLRAIFGFVGISDITFIIAEGMDSGNPEDRKQRLQDAIASAKKLGSS